MRDILNEMHSLTLDIRDSQKKLEESIKNRIKWCRENRDEFKKLYPKKGVLYKFKNISEFKKRTLSCFYDDININDTYYFKATDIRFNPEIDFKNQWGSGTPSVKGYIMDSNLNIIGSKLYPESILVTDINIKEETNPKKKNMKATKVYVMIDKNTGFYKIGRSVNPRIRERTLQSEKPTIEMIFNNDGVINDEKVLHDMFKNKRIRGEWFDLKGSDLAEVREYFNKKENV